MEAKTYSKLSYIAKQARVRFEFSRLYAKRNPRGADEIIERARNKMRSEVEQGRLVFYRVYASRLKQIWNQLIYEELPDQSRVAVTICAGAPLLPGIVITPIDKGQHIAQLSIRAMPSVVKTWQHYHLKIAISKALKDAGVNKVPNPAQIHQIWREAIAGRAILNVPLEEFSTLTAEKTKQGFFIVEHADRGRVTLIVTNLKQLECAKHWRVVVKQLEAVVHNAEAKGKRYEILKDDLIRSVRSALRGPERFGIDLPIVLLAAHCLPEAKKTASPMLRKHVADRQAAKKKSEEAQVKKAAIEAQAADTSTAPMPPDLPQIHISISSDEMNALVPNFQLNPCKFSNDQIAEALRRSLKSAGVTHGATDKLLNEVARTITSGEQVTDALLAQGQDPEPGEGAYLKPAKTENSDDGNFSSKRIIPFFRRGEMIARYAYKKAPIPGFTVRGRPLVPEETEPFAPVIGDGIEVRDKELFALVDGIADIRNTEASIKEGLVINGNIDLSTGLVDFGGDVVVNGNIESGANVKIVGNMTVNGSIVGGRVVVGGNLKVTEGIRALPSPGIRVGGTLEVGFIDNSTIVAKDSMTVEKSIINGQIFCMGSITLTDHNGLIFGGMVCAEQEIFCGSVGRAQSSMTEIRLGTDSLNAVRVERLIKRMEKVDQVLDEQKKHKKILQKRGPSKINAQKYDDQAKEIDEREPRLLKIRGRLSDLLSKAKSRINLNKEAKISVRETLSNHVTIHIAHKKHMQRAEASSVVVSMHGSSIRVERKTIQAPKDKEGGEAEAKKAG